MSLPNLLYDNKNMSLFYQNAPVLSFDPEDMLWPSPKTVFDSALEKILIFESSGGRPLTLASNYPYELWLDNCFVGDGGHRCTPGEALADTWEMTVDAKTSPSPPALAQSGTNRRFCIVASSAILFFAELNSSEPWTCYLEHSIQFAAKSSAQLPRQNILLPANSAKKQPVALQPALLSQPWKILASSIEQSRYVVTQPQLIRSHSLESQTEGIFQPETAENIALYVREQRPCNLQCDTYDLGQIALHRFEIETGQSACVLYYSEVSQFREVAATHFRAKVQLADAISAGIQIATPFGTRGCRYAHVLYPETETIKPKLKAWRREYPLRWKSVQPSSTAAAAIIDACRVNLIACIDGGAVDTCWRERAQWTGDLRMSALAPTLSNR